MSDEGEEGGGVQGSNDRGSNDHWPNDHWPNDHGLAAALADAVVVLAPGGGIAWVNDAFCRLMGQERSALLGNNGLDLVHPDELDRAIDAMDYTARFPGRTSVAPYRIRRGDGAWLDVELKSGILEHPAGDHVTLVVRDGSSRQHLNQAWRSVATGDSPAATAAIVHQAIRLRWPDTVAAVSVGERDGGREVLGGELPEVLADHAAGRLVHLGVPAPWELVDGTDDVAVVDRTELAPVLRDAAEAAGFQGFGVASLPDPSGRPACLIVWFDHTIIARLEFRHAAAELTDLLGLALDRRHHLFQLWHVASHDSLTGLLNRGGFFERLGTEVDAARAAGDRTMALLFVDLDGLKGINDQGGHAAGDRLLVDVADRLRAVVGRGALVARLGGDEFVIAIPVPADDACRAAEDLAQCVVDRLAEPATTTRSQADRGDVLVAASVGIAVDDGEVAPVRILEAADAAMYRAKSAGRSRWAW